MKLVGEYIKYYRILVVFSIVVVVFVVEIKAMRMSPSAINRAKALIIKKKRVDELKSGEYFVYQAGTTKGISVLEDVLNKSEKLKDLIQLSKDKGSRAIPITTPIDEIKLVCEALDTGPKDKKLEESIQELQFDSLISRVSLFDYFGVSRDRIAVLLDKIRKDIVEDNEKINALKERSVVKEGLIVKEGLTADLQRSLMLDPTIDCLKNLIMKAKNMQYIHYGIKEKMSIPNYKSFVCAFSPDSKRIVCCDEESIISCNNIGNSGTITSESFKNKIGTITAVAFSPDGKNIVFGGNKFLALYKISDLNTVVSKSSVEASAGSLVFSPDGKYIFSGGTSLIVWDASSLKIIAGKSPKKPDDSFDPIHSLAISPDGKHIVSGSKRLLLWNINDPKNMTYQELMEGNDYIDSLRFSPDGKYIVLSNQKSLILWDIDNLNKYVVQTCEPREAIYLLGFSSDSKKIIWCYNCNKVHAYSWITKFLLCDISDLKKINEPGQIFMEQQFAHAKACSPDGNKIVWLNVNTPYSIAITLSVLLTDEEISVVNELKKDVNQLRLVYELCLRSLSGQIISSDRCEEIENTFETLSDKMKDLLYRLGLYQKKWFSGCTLF